MRKALWLAALVPTLASAQMMGWFGYGGAAAAGPTLLSATGCVAPTTASPASCTVPSIPSGAVMVAVYSSWAIATAPPSGTNLGSFTLAGGGAARSGLACTNAAGNDVACIYTAVAGSSLTNEVVSVSAATGEKSALTVFVFTGANSSALSNVAFSYATSATPSVSVTAVGTTSYVVGVLTSLGNQTFTPGTNTYVEYTTTSYSGLNIQHLRNTTAGGGTIALSGTIGASQEWAAAALEIR